jgi:T5SS/PEP-CTERM-associated repeat protein
MRRTIFIAVVGIFAFSLNAKAQYTANFQTNIISGVTSNWMGDYLVGSSTFADVLLIQSSGVLSNRFSYLGYAISSSNNTALVSGIGSVWNNASLLVGGDGVANTLMISHGGQVVNSGGALGGHSRSNSVFVTDRGSIWNNLGSSLSIGQSGSDNSLVISNAGFVANGYGYIGENPGGVRNAVLVTGGGSVWSNGNHLYVGALGGGNSLVIRDGARVFNGNGYLSLDGFYSQSSSNSVLVTDPGSVWQNSGVLYVGNYGKGNSLTISNGAQVLSGKGYLGGFGSYVSGNNNHVLVTGSGSIWSNSDILYIGGWGSENTMAIRSGGRAANSTAALGSYYFSTNNSALISDPGSVWENTGLVIGSFSAGNTMVISNSGEVTAESDCYVGQGATGGGNTVRIVDEARLVVHGTLRLGHQAYSNSIVIVNGSVFAANLLVGFASANCDNLLQLDSGSLIVTNSATNAVLEVRYGKAIVNGGVLRADILVVTNECARFIRNGGTLLIGSLILDPNLSAVGDGISNGWKQQYGLDPFDPSVANTDNDGDGFSNLQEYLAGTDPTNSAAAFRILSIIRTNNDVLVTWQPGIDKTNALQRAGDLTSSFADIFIVTNTTGSVTNFLDVGGATNSPPQFYRVRLVQ